MSASCLCSCLSRLLPPGFPNDNRSFEFYLLQNFGSACQTKMKTNSCGHNLRFICTHVMYHCQLELPWVATHDWTQGSFKYKPNGLTCKMKSVEMLVTVKYFFLLIARSCIKALEMVWLFIMYTDVKILSTESSLWSVITGASFHQRNSYRKIQFIKK